MTKSTAKQNAKPGVLAGKTVAFIGDLGYYKHRSFFTAAVLVAGGRVVDSDETVPDYVVAGHGRGGKTPGLVTALQKKHTTITVLNTQAFCTLLLPARDELAERIRSGWMSEPHHGSEHDLNWDLLEALQRAAVATIDLRGESFRAANFYAAKLESVVIDGADLRKATIKYAHFGNAQGINFDEADGPNVYLRDLDGCTFRKANLTKAWMFWSNATSVRGCTFDGANMREVLANRGQLIDCTFVGADLSDAELDSSTFQNADFTKANLSQVHAARAKFADAKFLNANLYRADLRQAVLTNADLRNADLRQAVLTEADLTGANVDGANFEGANLAGAKVDALDASRAKNFAVQQQSGAGPRMLELAKLANQSASLSTSVELDLGNGDVVVLRANVRQAGGKFYPAGSSSLLRVEAAWGETERYYAQTFEKGMLNAAARWSRGAIRLDTVAVKGSKCPLKGKSLLELATAAWCEACGVDAGEVVRRATADIAARQGLQETMLAELKGGAAQIKKWNARPKQERKKLAGLRPIDLSGCDLSGANLDDVDLHGANLEGANLEKATMQHGNWEKTNFNGANLCDATLRSGKASGASFEKALLRGCELSGVTMRNANFRGADLSKTNLRYVDLRGSDLSTAKLKGATFACVSFDEKTQFPTGFVPPETMEWKGPGPHPAVAKQARRAKKSRMMTFDDFITELSKNVLAAKLQNATTMLKAERFQLFAEVKDDSLVGVVKSQSSKDLVYSCRLCADGAFSCCTQNLKPCGGLRGSLCKHLLVLIVGLIKAGQLNPATVAAWVSSSRAQKPSIDRHVMSETLLRYKGAEAGEVDWRPTETIPEDYYSL